MANGLHNDVCIVRCMVVRVKTAFVTLTICTYIDDKVDDELIFNSSFRDEIDYL